MRARYEEWRGRIAVLIRRAQREGQAPATSTPIGGPGARRLWTGSPSRWCWAPARSRRAATGDGRDLDRIDDRRRAAGRQPQAKAG